MKKTKVAGYNKLRFRWSRSQTGRFGRMTSVSAGTAAAVILTFLAVTFTYTCPGLAFMRAYGYSYSATGHHIKANPCHQAKKDICQSVRDRMLSIQVPSLHFLLTGSQDVTAFSFLPVALEFQSGQRIPYSRKSLLLSIAGLKPPFSIYSTVLII
ncbi:MAG: hypothetical protein ACM3TN_05250 [Alphaproteobacteria bacterium]